MLCWLVFQQVVPREANCAYILVVCGGADVCFSTRSNGFLMRAVHILSVRYCSQSTSILSNHVTELLYLQRLSNHVTELLYRQRLSNHVTELLYRQRLSNHVTELL